MPFTNSEMMKIDAWAAEQKILLGPETIERLGKYRDLIVAWSDRMNLVSRSDIHHILSNHILDSLGPVGMIPSGSGVIDVGSGAGLPGIPLAVARGDISVTLLESVHKKARFLRMVISELGLDNVTVEEGRLEMLEQDQRYDVATVRALPRLENMIEKVQALVRRGGLIIYYEKRGIYKSIHV